ncbi:centromere protein F-like isoform X2 [Melanerpes formicivorus]|uniref:centromere protein F-like isoform X2 n=1 Tax=Melanerpes formicivorus TaxID=211600 RepID=UPI00358E4DAC
MSWAVEEWKEGLPPRALQKIHELESQVDKLKKERQQRQFQLESLEAALQKQKQKVENEKNEAATLKREKQSLMELCDNLEKARQKISHDLHVKDSQVNIQAGQLNSSKRDIEKLEQELKRYKSELVRSQQTSTADLSFSGTPQKSFTAPLTSLKSHNDTKFEELEEKYQKKVQEKKKLEMELRAMQVKTQKINQPHPQSSLSHREIARHQASSSVFSWQEEKTPSRKHETPARGSSTKSFFPWEKATDSSATAKKDELDNSFIENCNSSFVIQLKAQNQELNSTIRDLQQQLQAQEKMKTFHMNKQHETELLLNRMKLELTEKDKVLNQSRDKLTEMGAQLDQAKTQVQLMEQKVKRLSEEQNCQRQNAESIRQSLEQKLKAKEKEYQQELSSHQRALQTLDQQWNQISNKLNQELQQAKNDFNALQAEFDKETKQENRLLNCQLEENLQQIHQLEEELSMVKQSLKQSQNFVEKMKNKNTSQEIELKLLEKLKTALADMEKQQVCTQDLLKEKDNYIKEQNCKISKMEEESEALQQLLGFKQRECEDLQKKAAAFSQWKDENDQLINKLKSEKEGMLTYIHDLESSLQSQQVKNREHSEKLRMLETECEGKNAEIRELKDVLESKSAELEDQKKAFGELLQKAERKYRKEIENMSCKVLQLTNQVGELEEKLQLEASEGLQKEQYYQNLLAGYEKICCLVKEKDTSGMTGDGEVNLPSVAVLEEKDMQLQTLNEKLANQQAELQDLKINNKLLEDSVRQLKHMSETWDSEKKDMSSMISSYSTKIEELTEENATLRNLSRALEKEQITLLETNKSISDGLKEKEEIISEMSEKYKEEQQRSESRTEVIQTELKVLQAKYKSVEEENANMMSILREQTAELEEKKAKLEQEQQIFCENKDILHKLIASEQIKKDLIQELKQLHSEFSGIQEVPSTELDCSTQEELNVRASQNTMQEKCAVVFQDKGQLGKELETKSEPPMCDLSYEQRLHSEQLRKSVEEKDAELKKYQVKLELLQMDFEDRELCLENSELKVVQLEAALKGMEAELEKNVREKERLQQELLSVKKLETLGSAPAILDEDGNSLEYDSVSQNCGQKGMDESCSSLLLASSLQVAINNLSELEKICERLQSENIVSASGFEDARPSGITGINVEEEKENMMNADKNSEAEKAILLEELMDQSDNSNLSMHFDHKEMSLRLKECSTGPRSDQEDLKLSIERVKMHFAEVREKLLSFQDEHAKSCEQHCNVHSKIPELQSCTEMLKAGSSALSTSLSSAYVDPASVPLSSSQNDTLSKLDETKSMVSFSNVFESSRVTEVSEVADSSDSGVCNWIEEMNQPGSSTEIIPGGATNILVENSHNAHRFDSVEECSSITPKKSNLEGRIEELQMLCQDYKKAINVLKDQVHIQENMKNEEIQELKKVIHSERTELDQLKQQYLSDEKEWQQKLNNVTMEMECKLAAERKQTENLSLELEAARFQLQVLDLSSHSLLCTDIENNTEEDYSFCHLGVPIQYSALRSNKPKPIPTEMAVGDTSVCDSATETTEARSMGECTEKISAEHKGTTVSGKRSILSGHANNSTLWAAGDFYGNQITTEMLWEKAKQQTAENLKLVYETEESQNHVDLLMKVEQLNSELNFQNVPLTPKSSALAELKEASVGEEYNWKVKKNLQLYLTMTSLEEELQNVKSELKAHKVMLSNAAHKLDEVEMNKRDSHEPAENDLSTPKFEQVRIEHHEQDITMLQAKCQQLERERDINMKTLSILQEHLVSLTAERNSIGQELTILVENKELDKKYQKLQEKLKELESTTVDSAEFTRLEDELRTQTNLLEAIQSDLNKLSNEKDYLLQKLQSAENDAMSLASENEKLQNEAADWKREKELLVRKLERLQSKLSASETESANLYKSLKVLLKEKSELAAGLSSAREEVGQMRYGIEKLRVKIRSDEKKKEQTAEKLKESERKADSLLDKIERLERELEMSEKNLEDAIMESEVAKAEAETLKTDMEEMTEKLKLQIDDLTSQTECLAKDLEEKQGRILELESSNLTTAKLLEEKEEERMQIKDEFENTVALLRSELKGIKEKLEFSCKEETDARAKEQLLVNEVTRLEQEKAILLQEYQDIKNENIRLDKTREALVQELMDCKQNLYEEVQEKGSLQQWVEETEEMASELAHLQQEHESWCQEKKRLQSLIAELKLKEQHFSDTESFQDILNVLKVSYKELEKELESTVCEKSTLCQKVNELTESHAELQVKLSDTKGEIAQLQEEFATERSKFAEEMQLVQEHLEKNKAQLHLTMSEKNELTMRLEVVQKELQDKESEVKREISEYKDKLLQAEKEHQDALTEAKQKNEVEIEACQEKVNSLQHFISSQKLEIEYLKSSKEELNNSLKDSNQTLGELLKVKADNSNLIVQLKKENEVAHNEVQLWMQSCKKMEQEKEMLQKRLAECDELSKKENLTVSNKEGADENSIAEEIQLKLEDLQESPEVKIRENLEKYCSLIVKYYKLEEENDMLKTQVILLNGQLNQPASDVVITPLLNSDNSLTVTNQPIKDLRSGEDPSKLSSKRQRYEDDGKDTGEPRSPVPETSSKKKRKSDIFQNLLDQEDTDDEPYGLPVVVKKGFAATPTGKISPYILCRTISLRSSFCLASPCGRLLLAAEEMQKCRPDRLGERSSSAPGGSKPQKAVLDCSAKQ